MKFAGIIKNAALLAALAAISLAGWRVGVLSVSDRDGKNIFTLPVPNGYRFTTGYRHSVELTPVEDEYAVVGGELWNWQERVKSSNAGMPSIAPKRGKYFNSGEWLVFQGGGAAHRRIYLRVGDENFGRNRIELPPYGAAELYKIHAGERLTLCASKAPLAAAKSEGLEILTRR